MACRLIPLDKKHVVRPITVGEVLKRVAGKAAMIFENDITHAAGSLQLSYNSVLDSTQELKLLHLPCTIFFRRK